METVEKNTRTRLQQDLTSNKTLTRTQTQNYGLWKLKYAKAMTWKGCRTRKWYGTGLMGRTQEHLKLRVHVNLTVYLKLWLPLDENKGGPIFQKVLVTLDLVETRHKLIRLPNNTIWNPAIAAPRLLWLSTDAARLISSRRLSPLPANRRTQARTRKNATSCRWKINLTSWSLTNQWNSKTILDRII